MDVINTDHLVKRMDPIRAEHSSSFCFLNTNDRWTSKFLLVMDICIKIDAYHWKTDDEYLFSSLDFANDFVASSLMQ